MTVLENTWNLISKIEKLPEGKRKEKILKFIKKKESLFLPKNSTGSFVHLLYRESLQTMVENFKNDTHIIWNLLDDYLEGKEI